MLARGVPLIVVSRHLDHTDVNVTARVYPHLGEAGDHGPEPDAPNGIRTRAAALKGRCPGPLDDGGQEVSEKQKGPGWRCADPGPRWQQGSR
jgi:hypothetical protein